MMTYFPESLILESSSPYSTGAKPFRGTSIYTGSATTSGAAAAAAAAAAAGA